MRYRSLLRNSHPRPSRDPLRDHQPRKRVTQVSDTAAKVLAGLILGAGAVLVVVLLALPFGWVVKACWNATFPALFGWKALTFWQGVALYVLAGTLLKHNAASSK